MAAKGFPAHLHAGSPILVPPPIDLQPGQQLAIKKTASKKKNGATFELDGAIKLASDGTDIYVYMYIYLYRF